MDIAEKLNPQFSTLMTLGERLKAIRGYTGLSRKEFAKRCDISEATWKSWESTVGKKVRQSSVARIVEAIQRLGMDCTQSWISLGMGPSPFESSAIISKASRSAHLFNVLAETSLHHIVKDNNFKSTFPKDSYLGCSSVPSHGWKDKLGNLVLLKVSSQEQMFLGYLVNGTKPDTFSIMCDEGFDKPDSLMIDAPITMVCKISVAAQILDDTP